MRRNCIVPCIKELFLHSLQFLNSLSFENTLCAIASDDLRACSTGRGTEVNKNSILYGCSCAKGKLTDGVGPSHSYLPVVIVGEILGRNKNGGNKLTSFQLGLLCA